MTDNSKALAAVDPNVFLVFDRLDDDQIIQEMKGAALTEYVYEFDSGGKKVRGLSKSGTDDASRFMAVKYGEVLREVDAWLEKEDAEAGYFKALVKRFVVDKQTGVAVEMDSAVGHKRQPKKDPYGKPNGFWYEQGGQKALRNAKQKLIPETIKQAVIANYIEAGRVRRVEPEDLVAVAQNESEAPHVCPIHRAPFRRFVKEGRTWYSHKAPDGSWCNEAKAVDAEPVEAPPPAPRAPRAEPRQAPNAVQNHPEPIWPEIPEFKGTTDFLRWVYEHYKLQPAAVWAMANELTHGVIRDQSAIAEASDMTHLAEMIREAKGKQAEEVKA